MRATKWLFIIVLVTIFAALRLRLGMDFIMFYQFFYGRKPIVANCATVWRFTSIESCTGFFMHLSIPLFCKLLAAFWATERFYTNVYLFMSPQVDS